MFEIFSKRYILGSKQRLIYFEKVNQTAIFQTDFEFDYENEIGILWLPYD
jgi:hypothetical protein